MRRLFHASVAMALAAQVERLPDRAITEAPSRPATPPKAPKQKPSNRQRKRARMAALRASSSQREQEGQ